MFNTKSKYRVTNGQKVAVPSVMILAQNVPHIQFRHGGQRIQILVFLFCDFIFTQGEDKIDFRGREGDKKGEKY